jgi:uncharacterized membrane protein YgcG
MDLDSDDFLDLRMRNVIVLDDLMSTEAKDPRINHLLTAGSHHRNLSVIVLNQNMYFGNDPTQRRNCLYLVLFKNPTDRQPIVPGLGSETQNPGMGETMGGGGGGGCGGGGGGGSGYPRLRICLYW